MRPRLESGLAFAPRRLAAWAAALLGVVLLAYANALAVPLLFDDFLALTNNPSIQDLRNLGAVLWPPGDAPTAGRPLLNLSFAINYRLHGYAVAGYHLVNIGLHAGATLALFGVVRRTLRSGAVAERWRQAADGIAWFVAALWAAHPVQTASVTYISQRAEVLMGFFYLLTLYGFVRAAEAPRQPFWTWLAVAACAGGMLSKETMVTAPFIVLLLDGMFFGKTWRGALARRAWLYAGLAATWGILAALMLTTGLHGRGVGSGENVGPLTYALTQSKVVFDYARLALWPWPLVFDYGREFYFARANEALPFVLAMLAVLMLTGWGLWRRRGWAFFVALFLILLAPTSSVVPVRHQPMAENRLYLPLIAACAALVCGAWGASSTRARFAGLAIAVGLAGVAAARNRAFRSAETLWADTAHKRPQNVRAHNYLADALRQRGDFAGSIRESRIALQLDPRSDVAHNNLGILLVADRATLAEGVAHLEAAARLRPGYAPVLTNLGNALRRVPGREQEGLARLREAAAAATDYAEAHASLGTALLLSGGDPREALRAYQRYVELEPRSAKARTHLAVALSAVGLHGDAVRECEIALRLEPRYVDAHINAANALLQLPGRRFEAIAHGRQAVELNPNLPQAWLNLGIALAGVPGSEAETKAALRRALALQPELASARRVLDELERREAK